MVICAAVKRGRELDVRSGRIGSIALLHGNSRLADSRELGRSTDQANRHLGGERHDCGATERSDLVVDGAMACCRGFGNASHAARRGFHQTSDWLS